VPPDLLPAFHGRTEFAICTYPPGFVFFVDTLGAPFAPVALGCGQPYPYIRQTSSFDCRPAARQPLLRHPTHVFGWYRMLPAMPSSISAPGAVPSDHGFLQDNPVEKYSVRYTRKRTQAHGVPFDKVFVERCYAQDHTKAGRKIRQAEQVENFRFICVPGASSRTASSIGSDRCDDLRPSPRTYAIQTA